MKTLETLLNSLGLFILRVGFGGLMLFGHGWDKLRGFSSLSRTFPDPLGIGSSYSLMLAVGAEFGCSLLLILGIFTRLVSIPLAITMLVAYFGVHANDTFDVKEKAGLYLIAFVTLIFAGGGNFTLESLFWRLLRRNKKTPAA
ncbi:MAG: DoxX family protein [Planctomycetaceae bacterium]|nr:DoxX family protein [Planctomycetaceae bacterium]